MFFIKAETQGFGFFVAGKPCAGGMVEENLRLFSISLFVVSFSSFFRSFPLSRFALPLFFVFLSLSLSFLSVLLFPALSAFPALLSLFYFSFFFPFLFPFFLPFFFRSFPLSRFAFPLFSFLFLFPFFLPFFFPLFPPFPLCSPSFFRFSFPFSFSFSFLSFWPSFSRFSHLSHFALPLFFVSLSLLSVLLFPALFLFPALLFAYKNSFAIVRNTGRQQS